MAQTGYTPIKIYYSATPSAAPTAGNLANGELAINAFDGKLFYKDSTGSVQTIATKAAAALIGKTTTTFETPGSSTFLGNAAGSVVTSGVRNVFVGEFAGADLTTGSDNVAVGSNALANAISASFNIAIGSTALGSLNSGISNIAIGSSSLVSNSTGIGNVAVGDDTCTSYTGSGATALGYLALNKITTGTGNTGIGYFAGARINVGTNNTCLGYEAGDFVNTGSNNVIIGNGAASTTTNLTTGSDNTYIGTSAAASANNVTFELVIGSGLTGKGTQTAFIGGTNGAYNAKNVTTWETTSDERIKRNIVDSPKGLAEIKQLRVRNFNYKPEGEMPKDENGVPLAIGLDPDRLVTGFIAQELQQVMPECVRTNDNGLLSVSSDAVIYALVKAVQELSAELEKLKG
jgi:hypothetical protein